MKIGRNLIQLVILCLLGVSVALTLVLPELPGIESRRRTLEISVLIREADTALWSNARLGMEQAAVDLGAELRFLPLAQDNDYASQAALLQREAKGGADAVIVVPADPEGLAAFLEEQSIELPVVTMESPMPGGRACFTPENGEMGRALAGAFLEDRRGERVLLLDTASRSTGVAQRLQACLQTLREAGVPFEVQKAEAQSLQRELPGLLGQTGAGAVIAFDYAATEALASVAQELPEQPLLYGVGATGAIAACLEKGTIAAAAAWSDYAAGYSSVQEAARRSRGERSLNTPQLGFRIVRGENLYEPDNQKLFFPVMY
ncbi:substrate-binding domain-containing protein [Harryflintia acetispora]|uniref:Monosaccharide ABC transporter substrate-binding protein (CUT2 family) n=1 Tax=Harryflintia acetispora TaxID=1849041 RepID=A0A9X8UJZ0_9FIRM|nr:substrate-binding domain-containing protein [Harryflintia acetispora]TCL44104.1 monosaccharide ABC transporter substrate-binding protein (CUT2 family) [Harryflintia acetispora]